MKKILLILLTLSVFVFGQTNKSESVISVRGSAIENIGELKDIWNTGNGLYISYEHISVANQFSYMFQVGYMTFSENPDHQSQGDDANFDIIPIQVGGRYYIVLHRFRPFFAAMTGANIISSKYPLMPAHEEGGEDRYSGTFTKLNFQVGAGLSVKLVSNLQIEILAMYNSHVLDAPTHYNITGLELGAGINWGW